ncbi:MAG TPA: hypothetical protein VKY38_08130 [Azoarcus sp.]|nr:hypothetical protein [Azoarcus sp.]
MNASRILMYAVAATCGVLLTACAGSETDREQLDLNTRQHVKAPIENAALLIRETHPAQYAVQITSGLPNGCASFERVEVSSEGRSFNVAVWNSLPADPRIACTMIYRTTVNTAELGNALIPGQQYQVTINDDTRLEFTAR